MPGVALASPLPDRVLACDLLIIGGGVAGAAAAYEGLRAGRTVCLTEITDWVGGQISAQGTSALDETAGQRSRLFYPQGYLALRRHIEQHYGRLNPGNCWVSASCFLPRDGHDLVLALLREAETVGEGVLHWLPNTIVKEIRTGILDPKLAHSVGNGVAKGEPNSVITQVIGIHHFPAPGTAPLNSDPLSATLTDAYRYESSDRFHKNLIQFTPPTHGPWMVIDATETGELLALADLPYRLGIDGRSPWEPSASSLTDDPYCTQGYTYTFAMEAMAEPQGQVMPSFYGTYAPYYSYELPRLASFPLVFTYRRIWTDEIDTPPPRPPFQQTPIQPGDISMQNWTWGNDYRPGTAADNLIYSREQLVATGQLQPGGWQGGLRVQSLGRAEEAAQGFYYWLVAGTTDSQLGPGVKVPHPSYRYLMGLYSPMGTIHGLSKYPYIRESRRLVGRPSDAYPDGFVISEIDISRQDYRRTSVLEQLLPQDYRRLRLFLAEQDAIPLIRGQKNLGNVDYRTRATLYPDAVGIGHYPIDFHPCMALSPPERPQNYERPGERRGAGGTYPFQIPLRAMIPQDLDNLLVAGKGIATSHIAAAAYRVQSFEWSVGAAAGVTGDFVLEHDRWPYELVNDLPRREPLLEQLRQQLEHRGNPTEFPHMSIFNHDWNDW